MRQAQPVEIAWLLVDVRLARVMLMTCAMKLSWTHIVMALAIAATACTSDGIMEDVGGPDTADEGDDADERGSAFGQAQYFKVQFEPTDTTGVLVINDEAAERMFKDMSKAEVDPEEADMKERKPRDVSLDDCEGRIGRHVICRKVPNFINDGEDLEFDKEGNLVYRHQCFIHFDDFTRGEATDNDAAAAQ